MSRWHFLGKLSVDNRTYFLESTGHALDNLFSLYAGATHFVWVIINTINKKISLSVLPAVQCQREICI